MTPERLQYLRTTDLETAELCHAFDECLDEIERLQFELANAEKERVSLCAEINTLHQLKKKEATDDSA